MAISVVVYLASQSFTVPNNFKRLIAIEAIGGGAAGRRASPTTNPGPGGGGGAYAGLTGSQAQLCGQYFYPGQPILCVVGTGGTGSAVTSGLPSYVGAASGTGSAASAGLTTITITGTFLVGTTISGTGITAGTKITRVLGNNQYTIDTVTSGPVSGTIAGYLVYADFGQIGTVTNSAGNGGLGGTVANSVGTVKFAGGNGGDSVTASGFQDGGGGGGAAGPTGAGWAGGAASPGNSNDNGGGGGGAGGGLGSAGGSGSVSTTLGGNGGNGPLGTGGGVNTTGTGVAGTTGTGGGGGGGHSTTTGAGAAGATYYYTPWGANLGPGGGGGGSSNTVGGAGAVYGGGGGGSFGAANAGGNGGQGIVVLTYETFDAYQPTTNYNTTDSNTGYTQDLGSRYLTKSYLLDAYPNIASQLGARTSPGLWAWGMNQSPSNPNVRGALGNNTNVNYSSPIQVGSLTGWRQVSSGGFQSMAVKTDGSLWGWGSNGIAGLAYNNAVGLNTTAAYSSPVQVGALTNWRQVSAGYAHTLAVKTDGTLWAWGYNINDAIGLPCAGVLGINNVTNTYSSPVQVGALTNWSVVAAGVFQSFAIQNTGSLWAWGFNNYGQLGINTAATQYYSSPVQVGALTNWKQISASNSTTAAIKTDGTLWAWGNNTSGQLGIGTNSATVYYSSPVQVGALTGWKIVSIGSDSALVTYAAAIKTDGTLWTWGNNTYGQLGLNTLTYYSSPVQVGALTNWKYVSAGRGTTYAVKTDGTLWAWGLNQMGQMGNNNTVYYSSPVQVGALTTWKSVGNNMTYYSLAIADGYI